MTRVKLFLTAIAIAFSSGALYAQTPQAARSHPVTQSGTWTTFDGVVKDGTGDTTEANVSNGRLHVDGSGVTQPVSGTVNAAQSGTWNSRTQDGSGNAIASSTSAPAGTEQGLIVRNIPSGTQTVSGTTFDGVVKDGTGDTTEANVSNGRLHVDGSGVTQPVSGTVNAAQSGTWNSRTQDGSGNAIASSTSAPAGTEQGLIVRNIPSGTQTVSGTVTANAGTGTFTTGEIPVTSGGLAVCYITSAASNNATNCKASAGQVYGVQVINTTSTVYYLRLYDLASAPTCSSATGFTRSIPIPHASGAGAGVGFNQAPGVAFGTGIGFCLTGGGSSTDNTNAATGVYVSILYK